MTINRYGVEDGRGTGGQAIQNLLAIMRAAGYGSEHVVRCGVWLDDPARLAVLQRCLSRVLWRACPCTRLRGIEYGCGLQG